MVYARQTIEETPFLGYKTTKWCYIYVVCHQIQTIDFIRFCELSIFVKRKPFAMIFVMNLSAERKNSTS